MKKKILLSISDLKELEEGKLTGGFDTLRSSTFMTVFGGTEGDNTNCAGANCVADLCNHVNVAAGCGTKS